MDDWVFIDTCIWIPYFTKPQSAQRTLVNRLTAAARAALIGPVVTETLQGYRRKEQADWAASRLTDFFCPEIQWNDWKEAANLSRQLAVGGHRLPLTDVVLAAIALRLDAFVYTTDPHFDLIPNLKRYIP